MALPASEFVRLMSRLSPEQRGEFLDTLPRAMAKRIRYTWELWARPLQLWRPGPETFTIYSGGRGTGKTRTGMEAVRYVERHPELCAGVIGIAGRTANDVNRTLIHGDSGLMSCYPPRERPRHWKSDKIIEWKSGVIARLFSGEEPDSFRGPNIGFLLCDEFAHWSKLEESWAAAQYVLRLGEHARCLITTTPLGVDTLEQLVWEFVEGEPMPATEDTPADRVFQGYVVNRSSRVISESTYANAANLASNFFVDIVAKNEGTELGDQEIRGVILRGVPTATWRYEWIKRVEDVPENLAQVVVAVDPSGSLARGETGKSAEVGIVVLGMCPDGLIYVLEDASGSMDPASWGRKIWEMVDRWGADAIVAESNYGGEMVRVTIESVRPGPSPVEVTLTRAEVSKGARAALVAPLYQSGRVRHCGSPRGFVHLERQMTAFNPNLARGKQRSPDRMDAMVWGVLFLAGDGTDRKQLDALNSAEAWREIASRLEQIDSRGA